jgi:hypothetical protein
MASSPVLFESDPTILRNESFVNTLSRDR